MARPTLFLVVALLLFGCLEEGTDSWPKQKFTTAEWTGAAEKKRYVFVRDILERKLLQGKTVTEVETLLGPPSFDGLKQLEQYITYVVKLGGSGFDSVFILDIRFNPTTRIVEKAFIRGD
jgi:hypothetical protein